MYMTVDFEKGAELKKFHDGRQDVMYGVDFLNCKTNF